MGLSQQDRIDRIRNVRYFDVIDGSIESLLQQAEAVAAFIRYYNPTGLADGHFSQFLQDLKTVREQGLENFTADGTLEPAQALLFTFVKRLHEIAGDFNVKWRDYAYWYLQNKLGVQPLSVENHKICLHFTKSVNELVELKKNSGFLLADSDGDTPVYRIEEDLLIENTTIEKAISVYFNRQKNVIPASELGFVTSLQVKELLGNNAVENPLFTNDSKPEHTCPLGFMLTSPSLLLREGKRTVTVTLENNDWVKIPEKPEISDFKVKFLNNIFFVRISTADGWRVIENYAVKCEGKNLVLKLALTEDFPATTPCLSDMHNFQSDYPALRIYLNYDAWLYPYSWLCDFSLKKIHIKTEVEGINNVLVHNDLGKIDCSKPFMPFGINTEKGALMVIGNYEMSVKPVRYFDLQIHWGGLPAGSQGFKEYYAGYGTSIDNTSFKVQAYYLSDYKWKAEKEYDLFGTVPYARLNNETVLRGINVEKMPIKRLPEESYDYSIHSKSGFVCFMLSSPEMGFGERQYRKVFSEYIMKAARAEKIIWKKKTTPPNEPYRPLINLIKLDYVSEETIVLHKQSSELSAAFYHISPFGNRRVYPSRSENSEISPVYQMNTDASILLALKNVRKGGVLNLYFDFLSFNKEINLAEIPQIRWYFGDGYRWEAIPDGYVGLDKTTNLLESGFIKFDLPEDLNDALLDENDNIWLRAAIEKNEEVIPCIKDIYVNVAEAETEVNERTEIVYDPLALANTQWKAEQNIAGIGEIRAVASYSGKAKETKDQLLMRLSEYASHRGKAVTVRDYERMTLQHFPDIAKVKCFPAFSAKSGKKNDVTLVIIPQEKEENSDRYMATSRQILKVEEFFVGRTSAAVRFVDVINPLYEEVLVRCRVMFKKHYPAASCRTCLSDLLDKIIAPWQQSEEFPQFDYSLDMEKMRQQMLEQEFVSTVEKLSVVVISEKVENTYTLYEFGKDDGIIRPSLPYAIFIPAKEHLITIDMDVDFGISEMTVDDSFIIS
jgi:hypothetical protein